MMNVMSKRRQVVGTIALVLGLAATAASAPSGPPIRIGGTLALTGPLAATALLHKIAGEIYVDEMNRGQGLLGRPVEWVLLDDQSKAEVTRSLYERPWTRLICSSAPTRRTRSWPRRRWPSAIRRSSCITPSACPIWPSTRCTFRQRRGARSPTTQCLPSSSTHWPSAGARDVAAQRGLKVVLHLEYEFGTRDFGPIAARIKDANPDLLWVGALGARWQSGARGVEEARIHPAATLPPVLDELESEGNRDRPFSGVPAHPQGVTGTHQRLALGACPRYSPRSIVWLRPIGPRRRYRQRFCR